MSERWQCVVTMAIVTVIIYVIYFGTQLMHKAKVPTSVPEAATAVTITNR